MPTVDIDGETARAAAERELAKPIYHESGITRQILDYIDTLLRYVAVKGAEIPGGWFTISVLVLLLLTAVVGAIRLGRRMLVDRRSAAPLFGATQLSAEGHRDSAQLHAASGDWVAAIRHRLRAVARQLEETGVLRPTAGRTATELARDAGAALPALAGDLARAAETFNDVSYGELPATAEGYRIVAELDDQVRALTQAPLYR
ncbi:DUF4129 domain-containing protein [Mycolicibacter minnesotensis]